MKILGDKKKKRYDEGLIDIVNKKFAEEASKELSGKESVTDDSDPFKHEKVNLYNLKTYDQWREELKGSKKIIWSLPDLYVRMKNVKSNYDHAAVRETDEDWRDRLRVPLLHRLITSSLFFKRDGKYGISHYDDFPNKQRTGFIFEDNELPFFDLTYGTDEMIRESFLRKLCHTNDNKETILKVLTFLSDRDKIRFDTDYLRDYLDKSPNMKASVSLITGANDVLYIRYAGAGEIIEF